MSNVVPQEWQKGDLYQEFTLAATDAEALYTAIFNKPNIDIYKGAELVAHCETQVQKHLPAELVSILDGIRSGKTNVALIRGVKFGEAGDVKRDKVPMAVRTMAALNALVGTEPLRNDKDEIRVDDIYPENEGGTKQIRSAKRLDYSNDAMAAVHVPEFGAVACVQGDPIATLDVHDVALLKDKLSPETVAELEKANFWFAEGSWMKDAVEKAGHMHDQPDHPSMQLIRVEDGYAIFGPDGIRYSQDSAGTGEVSQQALDELIRVIDELQPLSLNVQEGDIVIRNNRATVYGRSECQNFGTDEDVSLYIRQRAVSLDL